MASAPPLEDEGSFVKWSKCAGLKFDMSHQQMMGEHFTVAFWSHEPTSSVGQGARGCAVARRVVAMEGEERWAWPEGALACFQGSSLTS